MGYNQNNPVRMDVIFMRKRLAALLCMCLLCAAASAPARAAEGYSDVADTAWYAGAVAEVTQQGYMSGTGGGFFSPGAAVTRATAVTVLWRLAGSPAPQGGSTFPDVAAGSWYEDAAAWAQGAAIARGDAQGRFHPDAPVTRQELAVFLARYDLNRGVELAEGQLNLFADADRISAWAADGMKHAAGMGLLQGSGGRIDPGGSATRAQLAVILQRLTTPAAG